VKAKIIREIGVVQRTSYRIK